ncbi:uncharacterized protein LOC115749991 [Rhodamnia argentea]|uniref:Uncharacterized protein LOC115749991 n=1 Tax=Rhodamnia argentea TaxID=178133 RepID=A0ABM3H142_9MYRT|nr:uncharacterized protein LOC115749991 [Rhodamnia argentea]
MEKFKRSQVLMLALLLALLIATPLLSSNLRSPYLYLIFNLLIITLGAEAGLLSVSSKPSDDKRTANHAPKPITATIVAPDTAPTPDKEGDATIEKPIISSESIEKKTPESNEKKTKCVQKSASEKMSAGAAKKEKVKKCPSTPSLFFIGGGEAEAEKYESEEDSEEDEEPEQAEGISRQELFTKSETFIGNFYKQLKMQREDSWKKIHGLYQKAF